MKVLVLGGTGVISRAIVLRLLKDGHEVTVFNRGLRQLPFLNEVRQLAGNKQDRDAFVRIMRAESFDAVIDMISFSASDASATLEALQDRTGHFVFCSSTAAYRRPMRSLPAREEDQLWFDDPAFPYGLEKARMEQYLLQAHGERQLPVTVIRPSLTYGEGAANLGVLRQNVNLVRRIRAGKPLVMFGDGQNPWSFTFAPDLAKGFVGVLGRSESFGECYHVTSEELTVWEDLYREFGRLLGREPHIVHLPSDLLMAADPGLFSHLYYEKCHAGLFDNAKIRSVVPECRAEISLREGLQLMMDWWERDAVQPDEDKDRLEDALADCHRQWAEQLRSRRPGQ